MGLDMFLFKKEKGSKSEDEYIEIVYWRKANQIRAWFEENVGIENCKYSRAHEEDLQKLLSDCFYVLGDKTNEDKKEERAENRMPTQQGFFFGDSEYDEFYFDQLNYTVEKITQVLKTFDFEKDELYYYEWW